MRRESRRPVFATILLSLAVVATLRAPAAQAATSPFTDIAGTTFERDIDWLFAEGITVGCTPTTYCPDRAVSRGEMASFLVRMFDLPSTATDFFTDDEGSTHEGDINRLAAADITVGCTPTTFCPKANVRRDAMASFLVRAIPLTVGAGDNYFRDDDGTTHEADIDRAAAAGITTGCGTWRYCIADHVTRAQMAGFLHRVEQPVAPPPHPAPGVATLYVATTGADAGNPCLVRATPCRTIAYALGITLDGDTIEVAAGTNAEENLTLYHDVTIVGDPSGGTIIDASGGNDYYRIFTVPSGRTVSLGHLTLTGGRANNGGAILTAGTLTITDSTITGNGFDFPYAAIILNSGHLTVRDTLVTDNLAGGISSGGDLTIVDSHVSANAFHGVVLTGGGLVMTGSVVSGNFATGVGAFYPGTTITIERTTIDGNGRGGVYLYAGSISDSTISGNGLGDGHIDEGGIYAAGAPVTVTNTTVTGNASAGGGSAIECYQCGLWLLNSTVVGNTAVDDAGALHHTGGNPLGGIQIANTVVVGNLGPNGVTADGEVVSQLTSIVGIPAGKTLADILDPAGLEDNGGPTQTIALTDSDTNPALDHGDAATCAAEPVSGLDQRGLPRTAPCDIGAFELQP